MRRYTRFFMALIIVAAFAGYYVSIFYTRVQAWLSHTRNIDHYAVSAEADTSLVYAVKSKQWLAFSLPEESQQLRIIVNAHIRKQDAITPDPNWSYAIRYEFLDKNGSLLNSGIYHQRTRLTAATDKQGRVVYNNYYMNNRLIPLDGRIFSIGLQNLKKVAVLRISLETANPAIAEAAIRVYVPAKIAEQQLVTEWLRMGQAQKESLSKNSIYPASLLSIAEKKNLVKHQWQPLGPTGIEGKSYRALTLYTLKNKIEEPTIPFSKGIQADNQHFAVIPIPETGGKIEINLNTQDGDVLTAPVELTLQWFGRGKDRRWQQKATWSIDSKNLSYNVDGGLLVIRPSAPVIVNASLITADQPKQDISEALLSIKTYRANFGIDFNVLHFRQEAAAVRIDVRRLLMPNQSLQQENVRYQWLSDDQKVISSGELKVLDQVSMYDRIGNIVEGVNVSDPISYYFQLPPQVTKLRFLADSPSLLINAYNQPLGGVKVQRIPEDLFVVRDDSEDAFDKRLTWFPMRAANDSNLVKQLALQWISGQYRPPEDNPDVVAGRYLWQDYTPQGDFSAQYLLTDYTEDEARVEALPSIYCVLPTNQNTKVTLNAFTGVRNISPELVFLRHETRPFRAELFIGKRKITALNAMGQQGVIRPPEIAIGNQSIRLNTDGGGQWFMNYQTQCKGKMYLKRRVFALAKNTTLNFMVQHEQGDEAFTARLYSPLDAVGRSQIKVKITALSDSGTRPAITTTWTHKDRLYDIRPLPANPIPILYSQGRYLSNGERFAIPLNSDLPAGTYQLSVTLTQGVPGYVMLSQIKAGVHEQRRFYRENGLEIP